MSSKFRDLLTQARNRTDEDEEVVKEVEAVVERPATFPSTSARVKAAASATQSAPVPDSARDASTVKRGRPRNGKRSDPNFTQITAYISKKTHQDVKVALLREGDGRELSELVEECLASWLQRQQ